MRDALAVHLVDAHETRMDEAHHLFLDALSEQQDARAFYAAAGRTGARADEHQQHEQGAAERRPPVEIHGRKTGRCDDGRDLEQGVMEALAQRAKHRPHVKGDEPGEYENDAEIDADLLDAERLTEFAREDEKIGAEIDAKQDHKDRDDVLEVRAVVVRDGIVPVAEAARTGRAERDADRVEERHAADEQQDHLEHGQTEVDRVQDGRGVAHMRRHLGDRGAGAFRTHEEDGLSAREREHDQHEHEHAHAADPVRQAAPEHGGVAERLDVAENGRAGRGEAGNRLEERVDEKRDLTAQDKRQRADDREDEPAQRDRNITLTGVEAGVLRLSVAQERRAGETDGGRGQISRKLCFAVDDGGQRREEQKNRLDTEHPADQVANNGKIHLL